MSEPKPGQPPPSPWRLAGLGMELAGGLIVFVLVGYWVDVKYGTDPWGVLIGASLGIIGGLYNMIRQAVHEMFGSGSSGPSGPDGGDDGKGPKASS